MRENTRTQEQEQNVLVLTMGKKKTAHRFDTPWLISKRQNYKKSMSILKSFKKSII